MHTRARRRAWKWREGERRERKGPRSSFRERNQFQNPSKTPPGWNKKRAFMLFSTGRRFIQPLWRNDLKNQYNLAQCCCFFARHDPFKESLSTKPLDVFAIRSSATEWGEARRSRRGKGIRDSAAPLSKFLQTPTLGRTTKRHSTFWL